MSKTIFVKTLGNGGVIRPSYTDYWTMIEMWEYETCILGEIDFESDNIYIIAPDSMDVYTFLNQDFVMERKCKLVLFHIEWPEWLPNGELHGAHINRYYDEVWVCDMYYYKLLSAKHGTDKVKYMFLGGHPDFGNPNYKSRSIEYDFVHLMYVHGPRAQKMKILTQNGLTMAPNGWGAQREQVLCSSRWGLHLQQLPFPVIAPQRFMLFASYGLPIVSDYCANPYPYKIFMDAMVHFDPRKSSIMNEKLRDEAVEYNFNLVRYEHTFKFGVDSRSKTLRNKGVLAREISIESPDNEVKE